MSNEVTKGTLEKSLLAAQDYLDNTSSEQFEEDYLSVQNGVGCPARLFLDLLDTDMHNVTPIPQGIWERARVLREKGRLARETEGEGYE